MTYKFNPFTGTLDDVGLPLAAGGNQYEVLQKLSATDGDVGWTGQLYSIYTNTPSINFSEWYLVDDFGNLKFDWALGLYLGNLDVIGQVTCQTVNSQETKANVSTTTGPVTIGAYYSILLCKSGTYTISLPNAGTFNQRILWIKNIDTGVITVTPFGTQKIDGASSKTLNQWDVLNICCDGSNWFVL